VDDILLASNNIDILLETKSFLLKNFEIKNFGNTSFAIGIQIQCVRTREIFGLSQKTYIDKVLDRHDMKYYFRGDKLSLLKCSKNDLRKSK